MKLGDSKMSVSHLKENANELIEDINKNGKTTVVTQNGEVKVVVQDIKVYEQMQDSLAMLRLLSTTNDSHAEAKDLFEVYEELSKESDRME